MNLELFYQAFLEMQVEITNYGIITLNMERKFSKYITPNVLQRTRG